MKAEATYREFALSDLLHDSYNAIISLKIDELTAEHVIANCEYSEAGSNLNFIN